MPGRRTAKLTLLSRDSGEVTLKVEASNFKNVYLLWVANYCSGDESGPTAEFNPVLWDIVTEGEASGHVKFSVPSDDVCRAEVWLYPDILHSFATLHY